MTELSQKRQQELEIFEQALQEEFGSVVAGCGSLDGETPAIYVSSEPSDEMLAKIKAKGFDCFNVGELQVGGPA